MFILSNYFLGILISFVVLTPIILAFWLWFFHDRHINRLNEELHAIPDRINVGNFGRGVTTSVQELQIKSAQKPVEAELQKRESKRRLFLDRAHLISIFKLK
ncbi:MAG TPA: hypothetical protein VG753_02330 [Candidatus Paceibacterota bacterium]|nr:hypothetical protein [Candidatus Paceibacterota bacterium]